MKIKKNITVAVGYYDFVFDNVDEAIKFAEMAKAGISGDEDRRDAKVKIHIVFDYEDEPDDKEE